MVRGKDPIARGWPEGRVVGLALRAAEKLREAGIRTCGSLIPFLES